MRRGTCEADTHGARRTFALTSLFSLRRRSANLVRLSVVGYRSVRNLPVAIAPVSVFVGANGSGKTNVYRALGLITEAAAGRLPEPSGPAWPNRRWTS